ncbi:hypothetical protein C0J52_12898 [Blattella germanica]|nr:hypothetical protein C0J52_12898 [Blattella germanica]
MIEDELENCSVNLQNQNPFLIQEILENVMLHLDGLSLARSEKVSRVWKDAAQRLSKKSRIWKNCCDKEIDKHVKVDLLNSNQPSWNESQSNINWKEIYRNWFLWKKITNWPYLTSSIVEEKLSISCTKISGNCVVTGHKDGYLRAWTYGESWDIGHHEKYVTDIGVMISNADSENGNKYKHRYVVSTSYDHTIQINPLASNQQESSIFIKEIRTPSLLVRTHGNYFAVLSEEQRVSVWQLILRREAPEVLKCCSLRYSDAFIADISICGLQLIKVTAITSKGEFIPVYKNGNPNTYSPPQKRAPAIRNLDRRNVQRFPSTLQIMGPQLVPGTFSVDNRTLQDFHSSLHNMISPLVPAIWDLDGRILRVFLWRDDVAIILTDHHYMYVRMNGYHIVKYNTMRHLFAHPVVVKLYGEILLLGMSSDTDGSKTPNHVGAAVVAMEDQKEIYTRTQRLHTVFQAELCGIQMAVDWIQNHQTSTYAIHVDSRAALAAVANRKTTHPLATDVSHIT